MSAHELTVCLWFDDQAEEAAQFYTSIFKDGKIGKIQRYGKEGFEHHHKPEGSIMTVDFTALGMKFQALNGGTDFKFNESISFVITCDSQKEIDEYWGKLTAQGGQEIMCGWLRDKFGLAWQVVPKVFQDMLDSDDRKGASRAMGAMFEMKKFDIRRLEQAYNGH